MYLVLWRPRDERDSDCFRCFILFVYLIFHIVFYKYKTTFLICGSWQKCSLNYWTVVPAALDRRLLSIWLIFERIMSWSTIAFILIPANLRSAWFILVSQIFEWKSRKNFKQILGRLYYTTSFHMVALVVAER